MKKSHDISNDPDYEPLRAAIEEAVMSCGKPLAHIAKEIGMPKTGLYNIMNGTRRCDVVELCRIALSTGNDPVKLFQTAIATCVSQPSVRDYLSEDGEAP